MYLHSHLHVVLLRLNATIAYCLFMVYIIFSRMALLTQQPFLCFLQREWSISEEYSIGFDESSSDLSMPPSQSGISMFVHVEM